MLSCGHTAVAHVQLIGSDVMVTGLNYPHCNRDVWCNTCVATEMYGVTPM